LSNASRVESGVFEVRDDLPQVAEFSPAGAIWRPNGAGPIGAPWPMCLSSVSPCSNQVESRALRVSRRRVRSRGSSSRSTALPPSSGHYRKESTHCLGARERRGGQRGCCGRGTFRGACEPPGSRKWRSESENEARGKERGRTRKSLAGCRGLARRASALKNRAPGERHYRDFTQTSAIRSFLLPKHAYRPGALDRSTKSVRYGAIPVPKLRLPKKDLKLLSCSMLRSPRLAGDGLGISGAL